MVFHISNSRSVNNDSNKSIKNKNNLSLSSINSNPFGLIDDPGLLKGTVYTSATTIINQTIYSISSKIFSYETIGDDNLLDYHLRLWSKELHRSNSFGVVPFFHKSEVRFGASNVILGYYIKSGTDTQPLAILGGSNILSYMYPTLSRKSTENLPFSFNISAIDFDYSSNSLVSNYGSALDIAHSLNYPVLTPINAYDGLELQHISLLNNYLAILTGNPSINLFDGPEFFKTFLKFENLLSVEKLGSLYQELLSNTKTLSILDKPIDEIIDEVFKKLNKLVDKSYSQFEYEGSLTPETVFVAYGSHECTQLSNVINNIESKVGLIKIRVPFPFNQKKFIKSIPTSTVNLVIIGQNNNNSIHSSLLKADIIATLYLDGIYNNLTIDEFSYPLNFNWTKIAITKILSEFVPSITAASILTDFHKITNITLINPNLSPEGKYLFWGKDNGIFLDIVNELSLTLSLDDSKVISIRNKFDNITDGGLFQSQIISASKVTKISSIDSADIILIEDISILLNYDVLATSKPGGSILLINNKEIKNSTEKDIVEELPVQFKRALSKNGNELILINFSRLKELISICSIESLSAKLSIQLAFWITAFPNLDDFITEKLLQTYGKKYDLSAHFVDDFIYYAKENGILEDILVLPEWADLEEDNKRGESDKESELPFFPTETSFFPNPDNVNIKDEEMTHCDYLDLVASFTFPEAYQVKKNIRPDLAVKNFVIKVKENKRLTPNNYSRNIFHIEFDISGTGLKYNIGEALGIHGRNNAREVEKFLKFYNVNGDSLVKISNKNNPSIFEMRSVRQVFTEILDFLGKPPKRFYKSLAAFASDYEERQHLEKLATSKGSEELKRRQDIDFCTYVDILEEFKSARPSITELVKIITPLKRREYSIASSQKMHLNEIHLLIVVVDWFDPKGRIRYGHCSKYLSDLRIGEEVVVSVKSSVMKLPPLSTQPIIMAGLGTGLAPFKAFIEEKIWQKQQGLEIGEIYLYLGSRHKKEEYLYGEFWEACKNANILTHIGAAFSRDQPQKIYIQDKIRESIDDLTNAIVNKKGSFYLCGPTWPVPDITNCLQDIIVNGAKRLGIEIKDVAKEVENMKEDGRYILEVY